MKKLITTLIMCSFAVVVYLKNGNIAKCDRVVAYTPRGIVVEEIVSKPAERILRTIKIYIPNEHIDHIEYDSTDM